ncbi:NAD(P)-dependent oxidoreductase [Stella sp.]|uniref:NAD(P)-dependent oxidoreductase n=1 Tax=Stella sp. TaxID=2912054 RepID=UPI0035B15442
MDRFRVALSGDFRRPDGSPAYPMFDLGPLAADPRVEIVHVDPVDGHMPAERLAGIDALILLVPRFDARSIPADGRLALVARFGVGYDSVDVGACTAAGIGVAITPDGVRRPVAVAIVTYMLALAGRLMVKDRIVRAGPAAWPQRNDHMGLGLTTRTFGQLGVGNIGLEALRLLQPFGMRLIAHDPYVDPAAAEALGVEMVGIDRLFREADFLSVSVPLNAETRGIVDADRLRAMKPTAFLINTARGPVVDQAALTRALTEGWIAGAGIDVFEVEPCPADEALLALDNVILSPHSLCWTDECFAGIGAADVRAVTAVKAGRVPAGLVDRRVLDNPLWQQRLAALGRRFG